MQATEVYISIAFQKELDSSIPTSFTVWNVSLSLTLPAPPDPLVAPVILAQLPYEDPARNGISIPVNASTPQDLNLSSLPANVSYPVCQGPCGATFVTAAQQLFYAYYFLNFNTLNATTELDLDALAGVSVRINGTANGTLAISPIPFDILYLRVLGSGSERTFIDNHLIGSASISSSNLSWISDPLAVIESGTILTLQFSGNMTLDSLILSPFAQDQEATVSGAYLPSLVNSTLNGYSEFSGNLTSGTPRFLALAQGFSSGWTLNLEGAQLSPTLAFGWGNLFQLPNSSQAPPFNFLLVYSGQSSHDFYISVQILTIAFVLILVVLPPGRIKPLKAYRFVAKRIRNGLRKTIPG